MRIGLCYSPIPYKGKKGRYSDMETIPKPKKPQPLPRGGGWRLTLEELEALRNPPPPKVAKEKPPKEKKEKAPPPPPTMADLLSPHLKRMREASELKIDRLTAYRGSLSPAGARDILREAIRMRNSVAIMMLYSVSEPPTLATLDTLEGAIFQRKNELEKIKENKLHSTIKECNFYNERIAFLQCEIATYSLVLEYAKKTLKK